MTMTSFLKHAFAAVVFVFGFAALTHAEVVRVPVGEQADAGSVVKPERGVSSRNVERDFGEPISRHGPVGDPAIYFWEYDQFTVYFEDNHVIHAVSKLKSKTPVKK